MTVILVLAMFVTFLTIERFTNKPAPKYVASAIKKSAAITEPLTHGFSVPSNRHYHPNHTWALGESPNYTRVGLDDFGTKLIGKADSIVLPTRGQWVRQGQKMVTITRNGKSITLTSPIEGTIQDVNDALAKNPKLFATSDCYNSGWLFAVQAPDQKTCFRNLMDSSLAKKMISVEIQSFGSVLAQDGGVAVNDFAGSTWDEACHKFLE